MEETGTGTEPPDLTMRCRFDLSTLLKTLSFAQGPEPVVRGANGHRAVSQLSVISRLLSEKNPGAGGRS
jgi:hypothetical protein